MSVVRSTTEDCFWNSTARPKPEDQKMSPYGGEDSTDDCDSTASFSVMGDNITEDSEEQIQRLREDIKKRLKKGKKKLNIMVIGTPGVGKSAFITTLATALSGQFHEYAMSGHHGGDGRPMTFFMKRFEFCGLDDEYSKPFSGCDLPTLVDMAGLPEENNKDIYEEILRTIMYGRLPYSMSIAQAEEIIKNDGKEGLRKACPIAQSDRKIDRILFISSANEIVPKELIECVVKTCRPSGISTNLKRRSIPLYGVMTKLDEVDLMSENYQKKEKAFLMSLGLNGNRHRFMRCMNYCDNTAPQRTDHNYPELDIPVLKFFKQVVDPFITVDFDEEAESYGHLLPPPPTPPRFWQTATLEEIHKYVPMKAIPFFFCFVVLILCCICSLGPSVNMKALQTTCIRIKDKYHGSSLPDLPELTEVCQSLNTFPYTPYLTGLMGVICLFIGLYLSYQENLKTKRD